MKRKLHGGLEIKEVSLLVLKKLIFHSFAELANETFFQHARGKFVYPCGHVISSMHKMS